MFLKSQRSWRYLRTSRWIWTWTRIFIQSKYLFYFEVGSVKSNSSQHQFKINWQAIFVIITKEKKFFCLFIFVWRTFFLVTSSGLANICYFPFILRLFFIRSIINLFRKLNLFTNSLYNQNLVMRFVSLGFISFKPIILRTT